MLKFSNLTVNNNVIEEDNTAGINDQMNMTHRYDLRPTRSSWRDRFADYTTPIVLTNLSIPKAIKLYGQEALGSVMKEVRQLHDKGVCTPVNYENIENTGKAPYIFKTKEIRRRNPQGSIGF